MTNTNRAVSTPLITITVVEVSERVCTYKLFHEKGTRVFTFKAAGVVDRWVLSKLVVGRSYAIMQSVDRKTNRTHWTEATEYFKSQGKITANEFQQHFSSKKTVAHIRPSLLVQVEM